MGRSWTNADSKQEQSAHSECVTVTRQKTGTAFRAHCTAEDVRDYAIPSAESDMEINEAGFALKGWIADQSHDPAIRMLGIVGRAASAFLCRCPPLTLIDVMELLKPTWIADSGEAEKNRSSWHRKYGGIMTRPSIMRD